MSLINRRQFGILSGTSLAAITHGRTARADTPDPSQLTTTLTPMGAERAGNADGSIPAWTGGVITSPPPAGQSVLSNTFGDDQPLYEVNANNAAQYTDMLSEGIKAQMSKYGLSIKVYKSYRQAACPQYIYDNAAKNVTRAVLDPRGGRFGFTGAVGGPPFPIINTMDPLIGGAQLIWNHLTAWVDYSDYSTFTPGTVVINGEIVLVSGALARTIYPYYAPDVTPENFDGYYSKGHYYAKAPGAVVGQETLVWHSTNVNVNPDIVWTLLNGQGRVRKAPNQAFDAPNPDSNGIANIDESSCFYGNPSQYNWTYITKKEMLVPYNVNKMQFTPVQDLLKAHYPDPNVVRWEKHRVWVVEANLAPGNHNVTAKRRLYIDEDTWTSVLGEGYDSQGNLVKSYAVYLSSVPAIPGTIEAATTTTNMISGDYCVNGVLTWAPYTNNKYEVPQANTYFEPQQMAANAAF